MNPFSVLIALAIAASSASPVSLVPPERMPSCAWVARAADLNHDGAVGADERAAFVRGLPHADRLATDVDRAALLARMLAAQLDADGDGAVSRAEVEALRDFALAKPVEVPPVSDVARLVVRAAADANGDDAVAPVEWDAFAAGLDATVGDPTLASWLGAAKSRAPVDREALNAGVLVLSIESALDGDKDGRITGAEIDALLALLDANGDGAIDAQERATADAATPWRKLDTGKAPLAAPAAEPAAAPARAQIEWQRNLEDALAVVKWSGRPLLICVNMDGEAASDSLALSRYRDPDFVRLANTFVPMIVSPDLHSPRERDDFGRRLPDPRFGRVICAEHIEAEPALYERWFSGRRVAPRHVGVAPDGTVLFDVFLVNDLSVIDDTLKKHSAPPVPGARPDSLSNDELLASPDASCRDELESRFLRSDAATRLYLATRALAADREAQQPEILRLAFRDADSRVRVAAVRAFAADVARFRRGPFEWFSEAFFAARDDGAVTRELADAVLAPNVWPEGDTNRTISRNAKNLARACAAVGLASDWLPLESWMQALAAAPAPATPATPASAPDDAEAPDSSAVLADVEILLASGDPAHDDPALHEQAAEKMLAAYRAIRAVEGDPLTLVQDALLQASAACAAAEPAASALVVLAEAREYSEDPAGARAAAMRALPLLRERAADPLVVRALRTFVRARKAELYAALTADRDWPTAALADLRAAHGLLLRHPLANDDDAVEALTFLNEMDLRAVQERFVKTALARFPTSGRVQEWFRFVTLRDHGAAALENAFAELKAPDGHAVEIDWYRALASLEAARRHVEDRRVDAAIAADLAAADRFEACAKKDSAFAESSLGYAQEALFAAAALTRTKGDAAAADALESRAKGLAP